MLCCYARDISIVYTTQDLRMPREKSSISVDIACSKKVIQGVHRHATKGNCLEVHKIKSQLKTMMANSLSE